MEAPAGMEGGAVKVPHVPLDDVAVVVLDVSGQTEVTDLCHAMIRQQDVPRCNVSVDALANGTFSQLQPIPPVDERRHQAVVRECALALTFLVDRKSRP